MNRTYDNGLVKDDVVFFTGIEVEKTPAYGMKTLFVTGLQSYTHIQRHLDDDIKHIFFGANHSYDPASQNHSYDYYEEWDKMIEHFLKADYLCSLDIPVNASEEFLESVLVEYDNFIPQIRIPLPYIRQWNYHTMIKIDDRDFEATNPGVWCHSLHDLMDHSKLTVWKDYKNDKIKG